MTTSLRQKCRDFGRKPKSYMEKIFILRLVVGAPPTKSQARNHLHSTWPGQCRSDELFIKKWCCCGDYSNTLRGRK